MAQQSKKKIGNGAKRVRALTQKRALRNQITLINAKPDERMFQVKLMQKCKDGT